MDTTAGRKRIGWWKILGLFFAVGGSADTALGRPISYAGGWTGNAGRTGETASLTFHYSPTIHASVGYRGEYWREPDVAIHALQINGLIHRWNNPDSQANIYVKSGAGPAVKDGESGAAAFVGLSADWEDRRWFVSYENRVLDTWVFHPGFRQSARLGVAPIIGAYGDWHPWLMVEGEHRPSDKDKFMVTPLVRVFKGVHLLEAGVSDQGDAYLSWTVRL